MDEGNQNTDSIGSGNEETTNKKKSSKSIPGEERKEETEVSRSIISIDEEHLLKIKTIATTI